MRLEARAPMPRELGWLAAGERERLAALRLPRARNDFRRGRWTAKRAIARAFGWSEAPDALSEIEIGSAEGGAPVPRRRGERLPCEVTISHRSGAALCALSEAGSLVGCDLEWVEPRSRAFRLHFLTDEERSWLDGLSAAAGDEGANLLWSAKESAVKALRTGLDVDVRSLRVCATARDEGAELVVRPAGEVGPLRGFWGRHGPWVWTVLSSLPFALGRPVSPSPNVIDVGWTTSAAGRAGIRSV